MELGYWGIKGVAEPIRWLIGYLGLDVKEHNPACGLKWDEEKPTLGLNFPNLPYLIDGDFKITESNSVPYYLANKAGKPELFGKDWKEQVVHKEVEGVLGDLRQALFKILNHKENHAEEYKKALADGSSIQLKFDQLSKFLGSKDYLLGHITYVDFILAYLLDFSWAIAVSVGQSDRSEKQENLKSLSKRIHELPGVKERVEKALPVPYMPPVVMKFKFLSAAEANAKLAEEHPK